MYKPKFKGNLLYYIIMFDFYVLVIYAKEAKNS